MDDTPKYIKMAEKAVEIQAQSKRGSYFYDMEYFDSDGGLFFVKENESWFILPPKNQRSIWLPMQHQLQDMVIGKLKAGMLSMYFEDWRQSSLAALTIEQCKNSHFLLNASMEQLWLAFVMWQLYKKKWTGEDWETVED